MAFPVKQTNPLTYDSTFPEETFFGKGLLNDNTISVQLTKAALDADIAANPALGRTAGGALTVESGEACMVKGIQLSASHACRYYVTLNDDGAITGSARLLSVKSIWCRAGETVYLPVNWQVRCNQFITVRVNRYIGLTDDTPGVTDILYVGANFDAYTASFYNNNDIVKRVMYIIGDSITYGTGPTHTATMYQTMFWNALRLKGCSLGIDLKGYPGFHTSHVRNFSRSGYFDYHKKVFKGYAFGTNDAIQNIGASVFKANMKEFVLRDLLNPDDPNCPVIMFGPLPIANNTDEANAALIRTAYSQIVTEINAEQPSDVSSRLFYLNLALSVNGTTPAFDRTVSSNYIDSVGNGVHPSDAGTAQVNTNILIPWLASADGIRLIQKLKA